MFKKSNFLTFSLALIFIASVLILSQFLGMGRRLPSGAVAGEERNGVRLYLANTQEHVSSAYDTGERVYVTDHGKVLTVLRPPYDTILSVIRITDNEINLLQDTVSAGMSGTIYSVNRKDGSVVSLQSGTYFFTAPDDSYVALAEYVGGSEERGSFVKLTGFGQDTDKTYSLGGDYFVGSMSLSPDETRVLVVSEDMKRQSNTEALAAVFLIDITNDAERHAGTQIATFEEKMQEGPFVPFLDVPIVWNSDSQVTVTDDDGVEHVIVLPKP